MKRANHKFITPNPAWWASSISISPKENILLIQIILVDKERFNKHFGMNAKAALAKKSKRNQLANLKLTQLNIYFLFDSKF